MTAEEKNEEEDLFQGAVAKMAVSAVKKLTVYAADNLPNLIWNRDGSPKLPEVHEWLRAHYPDPDLWTKDSMAEALEEAGERYFDYEYIDSLINGIESRWLRGSINMAISFGGKATALFPHFVKEFQERKETILLTFLKSDRSTMETYRLLEHRTKLTRFLTEAAMLKLGIPLVAKPAPTSTAAESVNPS